MRTYNYDQHLQWNIQDVRNYLAYFDGSRRPSVGTGKSRKTLIVKNFPLPDKYEPDYFDLLLILEGFPVDPPKGIYLLTTATNQQLVRQLAEKFNIFQDQAFHGAPSFDGYTWICHGYLEGWRYRAKEPHKGDNLQKLFSNFYRELED